VLIRNAAWEIDGGQLLHGNTENPAGKARSAKRKVVLLRHHPISKVDGGLGAVSKEPRLG
jgi:hypothetical protein